MRRPPKPFVCIYCGNLFYTSATKVSGAVAFICKNKECQSLVKSQNEDWNTLYTNIVNLQKDMIIVCDNPDCKKRVRYEDASCRIIDKKRHYFCCTTCCTLAYNIKSQHVQAKPLPSQDIPTYCKYCNTTFPNHKRYQVHLGLTTSTCREERNKEKYYIKFAAMSEEQRKSVRDNTLDILQNMLVVKMCEDLSIPFPDTCVNIGGYIYRYVWRDYKLCICFDDNWTLFINQEIKINNTIKYLESYGYTYMSIPWKYCISNIEMVKEKLLKAIDLAQERSKIKIYIPKSLKMRCYNYVSKDSES